MSTNFYLRRNLSQEQKNEIIKMVNDNRYDEIKRALPNDIHIGKFSTGWKFLWNVNNFKYFEPNKQSLMDWLKTGQIIDEYGEIYTFNKFIDDIVTPTFNDMDIKEYYSTHPNVTKYYSVSEGLGIFGIKHNVKVNKFGEFYLDDLRCTLSSEFC